MISNGGLFIESSSVDENMNAAADADDVCHKIIEALTWSHVVRSCVQTRVVGNPVSKTS